MGPTAVAMSTPSEGSPSEPEPTSRLTESLDDEDAPTPSFRRSAASRVVSGRKDVATAAVARAGQSAAGSQEDVAVECQDPHAAAENCATVPQVRRRLRQRAEDDWDERSGSLCQGEGRPRLRRKWRRSVDVAATGAKTGCNTILDQMLANRRRTLGLAGEEDETAGAGSHGEDDSSEEGAEGREDDGDSNGLANFVVDGSDGRDGGNATCSSSQEEAGSRSSEEWDGGVAVAAAGGSGEASFKVYTQYLLLCLQDADFSDQVKGRPEAAYFGRSMRKVEEALTHRKSGLVASNAWLSTFRRALDQHPDLRATPAFWGASCEACGRKNHPASFTLHLAGHWQDVHSAWMYDMAARVSTHGNENCEEVKEATFAVGSFCMARSRLYHTMHHFKNCLVRRLAADLQAASADCSSNDNNDMLYALLDSSGYVAELQTPYVWLLELSERYLQDRGKLAGWGPRVGAAGSDGVEALQRELDAVIECLDKWPK
eukprot:SM000001S04743  [mRNA]  locus=s1:1892999:1895294:- [translate_table: standard]